MTDAIISAVEQGTRELAAFLGSLPHESSWSSCSSMPDHNINKILRDIHQLSRRWVRIRSTLDSAEKTTEKTTKEDLKTVKNFLSSDCQSRGSHIAVMAIVGMGGLGKTTLAQLAYNDSEVCQQFDLKAWVCVSEDLDLPLLTRAMVESFTGKQWHLSQQDALHIELQKKLAGKCFLLVLDDVWEKECLVHIWDRLRAPLLSGSGKSKIIVTTRSEEVSRIIWAVSTHHLPCLEGKHCLQLFNQRAFEGRDQALYPNLMAMAEKISKKSRGVPLVAKILGGQLRWEDDVDKWKDILEGEIWDVDKNGIMPVLRLSYDQPSHLRKCFKYYSLFPKGYRIDRDKLVRMWMAQGYLPAKGTRHMEDTGNDYFNDLVQRSFVQCSTHYGVVFQMHDLSHDLARLVSILALVAPTAKIITS